MQANRQVRVIKRGQRTLGGETVETQAVAPPRDDAAAAERDTRAVVAGWVREHREGVADYRRALSTLFARLDATATHAA